jgi:hypothetical protein
MAPRVPNDRTPKIPPDGKEPYQQVCNNLRRSNWNTADLLIALFHTQGDSLQRRWLCSQLAAAVEQMKFWMDACDGMLHQWSEFVVTNVEYVLRPPCNCPDKQQATDTTKLHEQDEAQSQPGVDPTWGREVAALLRLTRATTQRLIAVSGLDSRSAREPMKCLNRLAKILTRQYEHVATMLMAPPEASYIEEPICEKCRQRYFAERAKLQAEMLKSVESSR